MLKLIVRAALPLLAATAIAQAADRPGTGMITYIDKAQGRVLVDNAQYYSPASMEGIRIGDAFAIPGKIMGAGPFGTLQKTGAGAAMTADGMITFIDGRQMIVANVMIGMPASFDMGQIHIGMRATIDYMSMAGSHSAIRIGWAGKPAISLAMSAPPVKGRITYIDHAARTVLVNNTWMPVPHSIDIGHIRVGDSIGTIIEASKPHEVPARG